jgi:glutamate-1-semialdehyde 2,1-aminomutase
MQRTKSQELFRQAQLSIPGGVNSPVRAFRGVGGTPVFMQKANGAYLYDADGNRYIDYINSWGPMILGHSHPAVVEAIRVQAGMATSFGAPTALETKMAELIKSMVPGVDLVRMVSSGTEACMSAARLARGYTGRNKIIKFDGCYHGHADAFLVRAGSGVATFNIQEVPGIQQAVSADTLVAPYNDMEAVKQLAAANPGQIAAIIIEPVAGNMGCVPPLPGFLDGLRALCDAEGILLIFDEVMTGFRLAPGGAQELLGVRADLVTYGKVIGGGLPVGAFGGRREIMEHIAPLGNVYQAGTLSGNPIAMIAGYTTLKVLKDNPMIYEQLEAQTAQLAMGFAERAAALQVPLVVNRCGSMISLHFTTEAVMDFSTAAAGGTAHFNRLFHHMLDNGIYLPPSAFETWFISQAISRSDVDRTLAVFDDFCKHFKDADPT